jgi:hypothetical protein
VGCTLQVFIIMYSFLLWPMRAACTDHFNVLGLIAIIALDFECNIEFYFFNVSVNRNTFWLMVVVLSDKPLLILRFVVLAHE